MNWESYTDTSFEKMYNDTPVWSKKENLEYAGN